MPETCASATFVFQLHGAISKFRRSKLCKHPAKCCTEWQLMYCAASPFIRHLCQCMQLSLCIASVVCCCGSDPQFVRIQICSRLQETRLPRPTCTGRRLRPSALPFGTSARPGSATTGAVGARKAPHGCQLARVATRGPCTAPLRQACTAAAWPGWRARRRQCSCDAPRWPALLRHSAKRPAAASPCA